MSELLTTFIVIYVGLTFLLFIFQRALIYYPHKEKAPVNFLQAKKLQYWPEEQNFRGFVSSNTWQNTDGTVIVFHGNAGAAYHRSYYSDALTKQNMRVILAEYPGYGGRPGSQSQEELVNDALKTLALAHEMYGDPIYLWGESLGSGVVAGTIADTNIPVKGVVMFTPFDSLPEVAQRHYWYLPVRWLVKDQFPNIDNLKHYKGQVAVVIAKEDKVIPPEHGENLYEAITSNKQLWAFENAGHNTVPVDPDLEWWSQVKNFIASTERE